MHVPLLALLLLSLAQGPAAPGPTDDLATVRGDYANAAYEDALAHLATLAPEAITPELEQYRALCLLALGRADEGEQAFERLVRRAPLYQIPEDEIAPRMYTQFRDVRRRVLPLVVRALYADGKAAFDAQRYAEAVGRLSDLMKVLSDPDAAADPSTFSDLRQLADGFLRLSEAELAMEARATAAAEAAAAAAAAPPPAPEPAPAMPGPADPTAADEVTVTKIIVYSRDDTTVTPPVEVERFMPPWNPPAAMRLREYRGELEVIVSETGRVQEARMVRPTIASYDLALTGATERWRFEPARLNGQAVPYRLSFQMVLSPSR